MGDSLRELAALRRLAAQHFIQAIRTAVTAEGNSADPLILFEAAIDSMTAYFLACTEHDDASRHNPIG